MLAAKSLHSSKTFAAVPVCATLMSAMGRKQTLSGTSAKGGKRTLLHICSY
jgi:hypothetical protein